MFTVLAGFAEFERELIRARTSEGRQRAKARGVKLGRKFKLTPHQRKEALARRERGKESQTDIARSYNVSHSTISRLRPRPVPFSIASTTPNRCTASVDLMYNQICLDNGACYASGAVSAAPDV
jgi:Resolvase, N terminal domain/Helix-turn-helix domain